MASIARPISLSQPSDPTTSSVDHLTPLQRSLSRPTSGHYTLRRFSYISEFLPEQEDLVPSRSHSILRSASFSSMGFGFKEKVKEKENSRPGKVADQAKVVSPPNVHPSSPLATVPPPSIRFPKRPTSSHGLFNLHKPKGLKKKRSLASLLSESGTAEATQPPRASRTHSSDAASSSHLVMSSKSSLSVAKEKAMRATERDLRKEEYRQLQLQGPTPQPPRPSSKKAIWAKRHNMKVHTLQNQAVYMQAYDPILLENDRQLDLLLRQINPLENPSFHDYGRNVPFYVLDVGCGAGHWLLEAATHWNHSSITGFDMVDILIPEAREHDKIHFSRGNFLQRWPMPDKTFDLVRMANLSLCIPYDRWEHVLAEVHRVLTIDGRLELIDDQIFFPYAEEATARPTSLSLSIPPLEPPPLNKGVSFFEMDEEEEETDADSIGSQSTLISEGDTISSSTKHRDSLFISNPDAPSPAKPKPASAALDDDDAPTSATTIKPADTAHPSEWSDHARASKDMETVFEKMLNKRFGIHSRPSEFIVNVMAHVFGNGEKLQSYHLKLAPKDAHIEYARSGGNASGTGSSEGSDKDEKAVAESKKRINGMTRPWFNGDGDKEEKKRLKKLAKSPTPTTDISFFPPDTRIPETLSAKAAGRLGLSGESPIPKAVSRIPENVSAKAAHRLGIPMTGELKSEESAQLRSPAPEPKVVKATTTSPASLPASPTIATAPPLAETRSRDSQVGSPSESRLSAKAAHRLGISYSALTEAAASAKASSESSRRPQSSSSTLVNLVAPLQSPGLIVGSSTFIPMSPAELEMHTCKYIHTLIGCKPALAEYISSFVDEEGNRIESDEDFDQAIWDYECFRRRRFNWPSEIPDCWDADPDTDAPESVPTSKSVDTPKSATFRNSMTLEAPSTLPSDASDPSSAYPYKHDDLTHVRTLRVYEAIKTGEYSLSTLQFPRTAPRSPPR